MSSSASCARNWPSLPAARTTSKPFGAAAMFCGRTVMLQPICARPRRRLLLQAHGRARPGHFVLRVRLLDPATREGNLVAFGLETDFEPRLFSQTPRIIGLHQARIEFLGVELA